MKHGYDFKWTSADGSVSRIHGQWFDTPEERDMAFGRALGAFGYQPPKWWQFWRWHEPRPSVAPRYDFETI